VSSDDQREPAMRPEDLGRFFMARANARDLEGLVALYEPGAVLAIPNGDAATGTDAIRDFYESSWLGDLRSRLASLRPPSSTVSSH